MKKLTMVQKILLVKEFEESMMKEMDSISSIAFRKLSENERFLVVINAMMETAETLKEASLKTS